MTTLIPKKVLMISAQIPAYLEFKAGWCLSESCTDLLAMLRLKVMDEASVALAGWGLGLFFPPETNSFQLHGLVYISLRTKRVSLLR